MESFDEFLFISLILAITPGNGVLYIIARSLSQGRMAGIVSAAGVGFGNLVNGVLAISGVSVFLEYFGIGFFTIKLLGAGYLAYLGCAGILKSADSTKWQIVSRTSIRLLFRQGFTVAVLNPKTALFFLAYIPRFIVDPSSYLSIGLLYVFLFVLIAACTDCLYALAAGSISPWLVRSNIGVRVGAIVSGAVYLSLAGMMLFA